jgi:hypothetical protein
MKKVLWVEDNVDAAIDYITTGEIFNQYLDEDDLKSLNSSIDIARKRELLRNKGIFLEQDFTGACRRIFEETFVKIILDIKFPTPEGPNREIKEIQQAKTLFINTHPVKNDKNKNEYGAIFDEILGKEEYSGLLLFFIICLQYVNERKIADDICIFTGNEVNFDDFQNLLEEKISDRRLHEWQLDKYVESVKQRFWFKDNGLMDLAKFIEYDEYAYILERRLGEKAVEKYLHVMNKKNSGGVNDISESLGSMRNVFEELLSILAKHPTVPKYYERYNKHTKKNERIKFFYEDNIKIRNFIGYLKSQNYLNFNSLIKNLLYILQEVGSDFGPHDDLKDKRHLKKSPGYQPTANTVNALFFELREMILWVDQEMGNTKN